MGSPSSLVWQPPPKPEKRLLMALGKPAAIAPVVLLKTPMPVLTICTYWVAPTAPLVSGGAQPQKLAGSPAPRPRPPKPSPVVAASGVPAVDCRAPSG